MANPEAIAAPFTVTFLRPDGASIIADVAFLLEGGGTVARAYSPPPTSRLTVCAGAIPALIGRSFGIEIAASWPVMAERASSFSTDRFWKGGPLGFETYVLVANPAPSVAVITATFLREAGNPVVRTFTVAPGSRFTLDVRAAVPDLAGERFGIVIEATNGAPVVAERSLYWTTLGIPWVGGTSVGAVPLP